MNNNNAIQLVLPLDLEQEPNYKEIIKQNWQFTFTRQVITSVYAKRVVALIVAQMKTDNEFKPFYQIRAVDIIRETGLHKDEVYYRMGKVVYELAHVVYFFENKKEHTIIPRHLLDTTRYANPAGYHNGVLTVAFNLTLKEIIMELAHYSEIELNTYLRFSSWYSMRLWELLSAYKDKGWYQVNIDEYRELMGCGIILNPKNNQPVLDKKTKKPKVKYPNPADLIKKTTSEPLKEFLNTELAFTIKRVSDETKAGKGRRPIIAVRFDLINKPVDPIKEIQNWSNKSANFKKVYERLKKYEVHEDLIVKYVKFIGKEAINKLLYEWDLRQISNSKNPILAPEKYCNKVFKEVGEKAKQKQTEIQTEGKK
jgi:hypothetical protein